MKDLGQAPVTHSDEEWKKRLTRDQYEVLRRHGTEARFSGEHIRGKGPGSYHCAACDQELFVAEHKFDSRCGWPAFYAAAAGDRVILREDFSIGMHRIEVLCSRCHSHLGHVFEDGPEPTGERFCINSVCLNFKPRGT